LQRLDSPNGAVLEQGGNLVRVGLIQLLAGGFDRVGLFLGQWPISPRCGIKCAQIIPLVPLVPVFIPGKELNQIAIVKEKTFDQQIPISCVENRNWLTTIRTAKKFADVLLLRVRNVAAAARDIDHLICLLSANAEHTFWWGFKGIEIVRRGEHLGNAKGHSGL
jgi:hypothetical protein